MKKILLALFFTQFAQAAYVVSHWNHPREYPRVGEITQERTRPILVGELVYLANLTGEVSVFHRIDGYPLWKVKLEGGVEGTFAYGRSKIVVGDLKGNLYGLNSRDGSENWRFKIKGEWLGTPAIYRDKVFITSSADEVYALSETHGKEIWQYGHRGDEKMTVRGASGPVVFGQDLFVGFSDGSIVSLTTDKGKVNWTRRLRTKERFYDVDMSVYVDSDLVIAGTFDGKIYGLDRLNGNIKWIYPVGCYGGFYVEGNRLYFAGLDGNFYALDKNTSVQLWKTPFKGKVGMAPAKAGDYLVFTTSEDPVYVVDPNDGKIVWEGSTGAGTLASAVGSEDGWFYYTSNFGNSFSYEVKKNMIQRKGPENVPVLSATQRTFADSIHN